jgi:hypothetical protein
LAAELASARRKTHGMDNTPEYHCWISMRRRCHEPTDKGFRLWGARGITVCERWRHDFAAFFADMGKRPSSRHSLDRIDNNGPYSPENCRWATDKQQSRNVRTNRLVTFRGVSKPVTEWAEIVGMHPTTLFVRIRKGWPIEQAMTQPVRPKKPHRAA